MLIMLLKFAGLKNKTQIFRNFFEAVKLCLLSGNYKSFGNAWDIVIPKWRICIEIPRASGWQIQ